MEMACQSPVSCLSIVDSFVDGVWRLKVIMMWSEPGDVVKEVGAGLSLSPRRVQTIRVSPFSS